VSLTLPEDALPLVGDEELLERMFENLVRNARQAAGERGHVLLAAAREGESVLVQVEDDGPGLPPEVQGGIRPFFTTRPGGLGLGLPLANKIVRLHRGELLLKPRSPRGLTAQVILPAAALQTPA
jgi:signal transduction histidine kinase